MCPISRDGIALNNVVNRRSFTAICTKIFFTDFLFSPRDAHIFFNLKPHSVASMV